MLPAAGAPADWARPADAAEAWAFRHSLQDRQFTGRAELAACWWAEEVVPVLDRLSAAGTFPGLRDVRRYVTALAVRDRLGWPRWPAFGPPANDGARHEILLLFSAVVGEVRCESGAVPQRYAFQVSPVTHSAP